jgi:hypothetical protein
MVLGGSNPKDFARNHRSSRVMPMHGPYLGDKSKLRSIFRALASFSFNVAADEQGTCDESACDLPTNGDGAFLFSMRNVRESFCGLATVMLTTFKSTR